MKPGEYFIDNEAMIIINEGRDAVSVDIVNTGDRAVQVGSHFHFAEINEAVEFDREAAHGRRLDIPAGSAVRLEPGDKRSVKLIEYAGSRRVYGFNDKVNGSL